MKLTLDGMTNMEKIILKRVVESNMTILYSLAGGWKVRDYTGKILATSTIDLRKLLLLMKRKHLI